MITQKMQIQAVANLLAGIESDLNRAQFEEPIRNIYEALHQQRDLLCSLKTNALLFESILKGAAGEGDKGKKLVNAILAAVPGQQDTHAPFGTLAENLEPIQWLWQNWVPVGMLSLLGGAPGAGKSFIALDLARRVIHGETFPDGAANPAVGRNIIYVDAENVPQILKERAGHWRMDTMKLYTLMPGPRDILDLSNTAWQDQLVELCYYRQPGLVIVDSLGAANARGEDRVEDVREVLGFLNALAQSYKVACVMIHHLRKKSMMQLSTLGGVTIDDFRGSGHIIAMARSVLGLSLVQTGPDIDPNGPRRLEMVKTNLARHPQPIGIDFLPGVWGGVSLQYGDEPARYREPTELERATDWLLETLEDGAMGPSELLKLAKEQIGISNATLFRARDVLGERIVNTKGRQHPQNEWQLKPMQS